MPWPFALRALQSRNYRLFFGGQSISLIGTWMTRIATSWLVYRLTKSSVLLGVVGFVSQIPLFFLAPVAGVWIDRWDRHKILIITQVLSMLQSFALAILAMLGVIQVWEILVLMFLNGLINAFDMPARQSFVMQMVENRELLPNAIALNSSSVNGARLVGPAIGGLLIAAVGEGYCFLIDGISYLAVIVSLLSMRLQPQVRRAAVTTAWQQLSEGWAYTTASPTIRSVLLLLATVSLFGTGYTVLMPLFAAQILHGGPHTLGYLMGATGTGALIGAAALAVRSSVIGLGRVIPISAILFGVALIGFGLSRALWLSLLLVAVAGFGMMRNLASSNTILQTILQDEKRGRVMSYYAMAFAGMTPFGSLLAGTLAQRIGAPATVMLTGSCCIAGGLLFTTTLASQRAERRPLYRDLGILPQKPAPVDTAPELTQ